MIHFIKEMEEEKIKRDIRRYTCEYCGIVRSKKTIITAHIQSHHQDEIKEKEGVGEKEEKCGKKNVCEECGASFRKPAYLRQHMQGHSLEGLKRPFACPIKDCNLSYRRKDHLTRHLIQHEGKIFKCPIENCKSKFSIKGNIKQHVRAIHGDDVGSTSDDKNDEKRHDDKAVSTSDYKNDEHNHDDDAYSTCDDKNDANMHDADVGSISGDKNDESKHDEDVGSTSDDKSDANKHDDDDDVGPTSGDKNDESEHGDDYTRSTFDEKNDTNKHVCLEPGCGKAFRYASRLKKHEDSHVRLETVEAFCGEPGCMKFFTNEQCLKAHIQTCHQYMNCEICGSKQLRKNIKRHLRTHEKVVSAQRIKCSFEGCDLTFSNGSNLRQHVKAAHLHEKPFKCSFSGCGMRFSYKHVRDNHEKSGCHVYTVGDFVEADTEFQSRPRVAMKRKLPAMIDSLMKKRVLPPSESDCMRGPDYVAWLLSAGGED